MVRKVPVTVAYGDGIGPEIMDATLSIILAAGARLDIERVEIGEKVYLRGRRAGIEPATWESIRRTGVFLKAPITTPQGGGFKSLNVTIRTQLGLYANVRPCVSYHPFVKTLHPGMDVVVIRENEEDLYTGIEYRQTQDAVHALKIITRSGCERIVRYAFDYAVRHQRKKVTCFTKDNILKLSDGLFHKVFEEVGAEYPQIEQEHWIVDIGAAKLADTPYAFDVVVMPNLYGDILSDVAAQIAGSVGMAGSANIGPNAAMFEAIHGSAPRRAGQNLANPSGLLMGAIMMLNHINQAEVAEAVHNAWLCTIEDGIHTYDIHKPEISRQQVGTKEFAEAVIRHLGKKPHKLHGVSYKNGANAEPSTKPIKRHPPEKRELVGIDIFLQSANGVTPIQQTLEQLSSSELQLSMISNRGARVWPDGVPETNCVDQWRCRFLNPTQGHSVPRKAVLNLLKKLFESDLDLVKTENLYLFDGRPGYSVSHEEQ